MTEETSLPSALFELYRDSITAQSRLFPSGQFATLLMQAGRTVFDAQIAYAQALIGAHAALIGAWTEKPDAAAAERPSQAVKRNEVMTA
jgi:hypothetical protein